jgi:hypothetical protein
MRLIKRKLEDLWSIYRKAKDPFQRGRLTSTAMVNYTDKLASQCDKLFDVAASTEQQLATCKEQWCVDMSPHEWQYLEDQRTNRNMVCSHGVDMVTPVWTLLSRRLLTTSTSTRSTGAGRGGGCLRRPRLMERRWRIRCQPSMPTSETRRGLSRTLTRCPTAEISVTTSWRPGLSMFGSRHGGQQPHPPLALPSLSPPRDMVHFDMGAVKVNSRVLQM